MLGASGKEGWDLDAQISEHPQGIVVKFAGDIGMIEVDALAAHFKRILERKPKLVVIDLSGVGMLASAGIGSIIALRRDLGKTGGAVRLAATRPQVRESLRRALVDRIVQMFDTVEAALGAA
jgi:anti-sigma B factor antagonist